MFKNPIVHSLLQIAGLSVIALLLTNATPKAAPVFDECDDQFAACQQKCGTYDWTIIYYQWNPETQQWDIPVYGYVWTDHIDYFECQPGSGHGICECSM